MPLIIEALGVFIVCTLIFEVFAGPVLLFRMWNTLSELRAELREMAVRIAELERTRVPKEQVRQVVTPPREATEPRPASVPSIRPASPIDTPLLEARPAAPEQSSEDSLEAQIGARWLLYAGVVAIIVGVAYFEKLAYDNHSINELGRVVQGGVVGALLVYAGLRFLRVGYTVYGQMISGCGIAVLYLSTYAAFNFYHLVSRPSAFVIMSLITAAATWLADRERSQGLAILAVAGGFATPFLLSTHSDAEVALFGYVAILIAGTAWLARRQEWLALHMVTYVLTGITLFAWAASFYEPGKYLTTEFFLTLFCGMYLYILFAIRRSSHDLAPVARIVLWSAPFAYYVASLAVLTGHSAALLVYLVMLGLTGALVSSRITSARHQPNIQLLFLLACFVPLLFWALDLSWADYGRGARAWLYPGLETADALYLINLLTYLERTVGGGPDRDATRSVETALVHLNGLAAYAVAYLLISPITLGGASLAAALFAGWNGLLALKVAKPHRESGLHFAGLAFTLLTVAIGIEFNGAWLTAAWAAEGTTIAALGLREQRRWLHWGGLFVFAVAVVRLFDLLLSPPSVGESVLLNLRFGCAAWVTALLCLLAWLHVRYLEAPAASRLIAALVVLANVVALAAITSEISSYWSIRALEAYGAQGLRLNADFAREMMTSIVWASYAMLAIVCGIRRHYPPVRYFAIAVFGLTILKVVAVDLQELDRAYRVSSILGLGVALLMASDLYHRFTAGQRGHAEGRHA